MRWPWVLGGIGLLIAAAGSCVAFRTAVFDPESRRLPHAQLKVGMTLPEVQAAMSDSGASAPRRGEPQPVFVTGSMSYWEKNEYFKHRWEDPYTRVDVTFQGPKGAATVIHIEPRSKEQPDVATIWFPRIGLLAVTVTGLVFIARGRRQGEPSLPA
jgi:hypothetical protein